MTRALRAECAEALCTSCFIKRDDSGRALFISDHPRRHPDDTQTLSRLTARGFTAVVERGMLYIDLSPARYAAFASALPDSPIPETLSPEARSICLRLARANTPPDKQPVAPIRLALQYLDQNDIPGLCAALTPMLAVLQRNREPLPSCVARLIIRHAESVRS